MVPGKVSRISLDGVGDVKSPIDWQNVVLLVIAGVEGPPQSDLEMAVFKFAKFGCHVLLRVSFRLAVAHRVRINDLAAAPTHLNHV